MKPGQKLPPVGRELDALIAEKVMNRSFETYEEWMSTKRGNRSEEIDRILHKEYESEKDMFLSNTPRYSTDISAAWQIIEHMKDQWCFNLLWINAPTGTDAKLYDVSDLHEYSRPNITVTGISVPHAICLAALKVVEGKK